MFACESLGVLSEERSDGLTENERDAAADDERFRDVGSVSGKMGLVMELGGLEILGPKMRGLAFQ